MDTDTLINIVEKKMQIAPFTDTGKTAGGEFPGNPAYRIQLQNIYSQDIPATTSNLTYQSDANWNPSYANPDNSYYGTKEEIQDYLYIKRYKEIPLGLLNGNTYFWEGTDTADILGTNILQDAIPSGQDPGGSYIITVLKPSGGVYLTTSDPYFFDPSTGYVSFNSSISYTPRINFHRYEGIKGLNNIVGDLAVTGEVSATSFNATSDVRLKKEIKPLENSLEKICSLQGVEFEFINDLIQRKNIGFIAQDIEKIIPQVVTTSEKGEQYKSVAYGNIVALLVEAIKELREEIETLKNK